jgi:hypothetical protein
MEIFPTLFHAEKSNMPFLHAGQVQSCFCESAEQTGEHHTPYATPLPTPQEHNLAQPLDRLNLPPEKKKKKNLKA